MQSHGSLLPNDYARSSKCFCQLTSLVASLTVGNELNYQDRDTAQEQDMDEAAFVKDKLQDEPDYQQT